jgi:hypothetical protein
MSNTATIATELNIRVPAGHTIMADDQTLARKKTEQYVANLLAGLGVPGAINLSWEKQPPKVYQVEVAVNGAAARLRYTTTNSLGVSPEMFSIALCEDILRNRALFVSPALVRYATGKAHATLHRFDEKGRERIVQTLIAQGFGLHRLQHFAPDADIADNTLEAWAEACIGDLEAAQFIMHAPPGQIDPDENPLDFNRLIESADYFVDIAFKIKGIPFPKIKGLKRDDFEANEMAFQINDLLFPTRQIADIATENLQFVNFLTSNGAFFLNRGAVNFLLDSLESANPNLLALARTRFTTDFITSVLRNLAVENISIRPVVRILEILVGGGQDVYRQQTGMSEAPPLSETVHLIATDKRLEHLDLADWSELVRMNLKNAIINRALLHFEEPQALSCFYFENSLLEKITRFDTLSPAEQTSLRETLHRHIAEGYLTPAGKIRPVITSAAWRKKISDLIAFEFPDTPVFSLQECLPRIVARYDKLISV